MARSDAGCKRGGSCGRQALRFLPRIVDRNSAMAKVLDISCCKREPMAPCGCCDQAIHHGEPVTFFFCVCLKCGPLVHLCLAQRNHATGKGGKKFGFQPTPKFCPLLAFRKQQNAFPDFRYGDEADEQREGGSGAQPCCGMGVRVRPCRLAQDICIQQVVQNDTWRGRSLLRAKSSSLKSAGQSLNTSQIPRSGSCSLHQSSALTMTTNGLPCFVTSWGTPFAALSATAEKRCLAVWSWQTVMVPSSAILCCLSRILTPQFEDLEG